MKNTVCELSPLITSRKIELLLTASIFIWSGNMCFPPASVSPTDRVKAIISTRNIFTDSRKLDWRN